MSRDKGHDWEKQNEEKSIENFCQVSPVTVDMNTLSTISVYTSVHVIIQKFSISQWSCCNFDIVNLAITMFIDIGNIRIVFFLFLVLGFPPSYLYKKASAEEM